MIVLGISGTPRAGGNSEILLDHALRPFGEAGWEVEKILMSRTSILPCTGCELCVERGQCALRDNMDRVYGAFERCDALIISAPAYWRNVPAQLKALIDRSYAQSSTRPLLGKVGGAIAVGRGSSGGQSIVLNILHNFYLSSGMVCVPGELNGVTAVANAPGDILSQPRRLEQARILGGNVLRWAEATRGLFTM